MRRRLYRSASTSAASNLDVDVIQHVLGIKTIIDFRPKTEPSVTSQSELIRQTYPDTGPDVTDSDGSKKTTRRIEIAGGKVLRRALKGKLTGIAKFKVGFLLGLSKAIMQLRKILKFSFEFFLATSLPTSVDKYLENIAGVCSLVSYAEFFGGLPNGTAEFYFLMCKYNGAKILKVLNLFKESRNYPILFNCTSGKDRTGTIAALVLSMCGMSKNYIVNDYHKSHAFVVGSKHAESLGCKLPSWLRTRPTMVHLLGAEKRTMSCFLDKMKKEYGSINGYLDSIGFSKDDRSKVQGLLLENGPLPLNTVTKVIEDEFEKVSKEDNDTKINVEDEVTSSVETSSVTTKEQGKSESQLERKISPSDQIDKVYETGNFKECYKLCKSFKDCKTNVPIMWRLARVYKDLSEDAGSKGRTENQGKYGEKCLGMADLLIAKEDPTAKFHGYKWKAIALGILSGLKNQVAQMQDAALIKEACEEAIRFMPAEKPDSTPYHILGRLHYSIAALPWMLRTMLPATSFDEAIKNFREVEKIEAPTPGSFLQNTLFLGKALQKNGNTAEAIDAFKKVLSDAEKRGLSDLSKTDNDTVEMAKGFLA
eukprot:g2722.t1